MVKNRLLTPLFRLLAKPGLGNPHTPQEIELLKAGAKPTAIINKNKLEQLEEEIKNGQIVILEEKKNKPWSFEFYYKPENEDIVNKTASISQKTYNGTKSTVSETAFMNNFFQEPPDLGKQGRLSEIAWYRQKSTVISDLYGKNIDYQKHRLAKGEILPPHALENQWLKMLENDELLFICRERTESSPEGSLHKAYQQNKLSHKNFDLERPRMESTYIVAQSDKLQDGKMLCNIWMKRIVPESIAKLKAQNAPGNEIQNEFDKTIGQLLGYTQNDIDWNAGHKKYTNPLIKKIMATSEKLRQKARIHVMLVDAEKKRNQQTSSPEETNIPA